jgi:hypothetical protein
VRDWSVSIEIKEDSFAAAQLTPGARDLSDAGAALLGLAHRSSPAPSSNKSKDTDRVT